MVLDAAQYRLIQETLLPYGPKKIGIFGSYARGDANENSDLDILVSFSGKITLWDIIGLEEELSAKLNKDVDLITERSLNPRLAPYVYKDLKIIMG